MDERCAVHKGTYSFGREGDFGCLFLGEKEILNNPFREKGKNSVFDCSFLSGFRPFGGHKPCFDEGRATAKARCKRKTGRRAVQVSECARRGGGDGKKTPRFSSVVGTFFRNSRALFGTSRRVFVGAADGAASGREEDANPHLVARSTRAMVCREAGCGAGTLRAVG